MTKYCRAPRCSNSAGQPRRDQRRLSFYKFPLHSPERLRQWLSQMNQEKWVPTKHQHLCSDHFAPSCFEYRWGVRYLKPDAVPTIFQTSDSPLKRESPDKPPSNSSAKKLALDCDGEGGTPAAQTPTCQEPNTMETLAIAIDPSVAATPVYLETQSSAPTLDFQTLSGPLVGAVNLLPLVQIVEPLKAVTLAVASPTPAVAGQALQEPLEQQVVDFVASLPPASLGALPSSSLGLPGQLCAEVALPCELVAAGDQPSLQALMAEPAAVAEQGALVIENISIEPFLDGSPSVAVPILSPLQGSTATEMVAYFETIPTAPVAAAASSGVTPPETVLSSALSLPIVSTLPIVSNQAPLEGEELKLDEGSSAESSEEQLEEHGYHRNEGTTAELVEVVMGLQKKVKVLQQRHRRHCAKLDAMKSMVEQLWKENLASEEKLKLLEVACLQSSTFAPESGGAVAIICQEREQALVYAVPQLPSEGSETILRLEEQ
ncbi:THAP domain-containing protein 8 isoform X1 [Crotalus tigris]|uniref:THAP domain-containing protein 8 isoform X1 n=2 Tax=Crotalus tigris TaxID=88082 RepID=UPI00192F9296|nr:THAP domain-containing protein 8 isoform X1 [Crotalus tigris]